MAGKASRSGFDKGYIWFLVGPPAILVAVTVILVFVDRRLDIFEDTLQYRPPHVPADRQMDDHGSIDLQGQIVYVPVYSHVYHEDGRSLLLTVTLSIRNTSMDRDITIKSVRYFDTQGRQVKSYLSQPLRISAMATTEFLVERTDASGGSGANFLVEWAASQPVTEPIIEAVMISTRGQQGISFARVGRVIQETGKPEESPEPNE